MVFKKYFLETRGMLTIGMALAIGIVMAVAFQAFTLTIRHKTKQLLRQVQAVRQVAIFDMIDSRVLQELKQRYADSDDSTKIVPIENPPSLNYLLRPTSRYYNQTFPRVFGKGQFQIDLRANGLGGGAFVAPETDVTVFISPTIGNGYYLVNVRASVCKDVVYGRVRFPEETVATPNPGLGVNWSVPCGAGRTIAVNHSLFVNIGSLVFQ